MSAYFTKDVVVAGGIPPQQLVATATITSGQVDLWSYGSAFFDFLAGLLGGTSPTLSAVLQVQESSDGISWTNNATIPPYTLVGSASAEKQATLEVLALQLGSGKRYARLQATCTIGGTTPTVPIACASYGYNPVPRPTTGLADSSVVSQTAV